MNCRFLRRLLSRLRRKPAPAILYNADGTPLGPVSLHKETRK